MCGGGECNTCGGCVGDIAYTTERCVMFIAGTGIVSCIIVTVLIMLGMGVGLGYNYCFVESKLNATLRSASRKSYNVRRSEVSRKNNDESQANQQEESRSERKRRSKDLIHVPDVYVSENDNFDDITGLLKSEFINKIKMSTFIDRELNNKEEKRKLTVLLPVIERQQYEYDYIDADQRRLLLETSVFNDDESRPNDETEQTTVSQSVIKIMPTMVVPIRHTGLIYLIEKLQKCNSNFTLELVEDIKVT